jgi:hypothetical protein
MQTMIWQHRGQQPSATLWKRSGCTLAVLGSLAGCGGGDASSLIGAALVTSSATQAVPPADPSGQAASVNAPAGAPAVVAHTVVASDSVMALPDRR